MAAKIDITYDPKAAKDGLGQLQKQAELTEKSIDKLGNEAVSSAKQIESLSDKTKSNAGRLETLTKNFNGLSTTVRQNTEGVGQFASALGQAGSAMGGASGKAVAFIGQLGGMADAAVSASAAFGPVGLAIAGVTAVVTAGIAIYQSYAEAERQAAEAAEELRKKEIALREEMERSARERERNLLGTQFDVAHEFTEMLVDLRQAQHDNFIAEQQQTKTLATVRRELVEAKREEVALIKEGATTVFQGGDIGAIEKFRRDQLNAIHEVQVRINALKQRETEILQQQKSLGEQIADGAQNLWMIAKGRFDDAERSVDRLKSKWDVFWDAQKKRLAEHQKSVDQLVHDLSSARTPSGGIGGQRISDANPLPVKVLDDPGVVTGQRQANPFRTGGLAGQLMGGQSLAAQSAITRQQAAIAQTQNVRMGNVDRQARGDFSMDRRGLTVAEMRGQQAAAAAGPAAQQAGLTPDQMQQMVASSLGDRAITQQVVRERKASGAAGASFRQAKPGGATEATDAERARAIEKLAEAELKTAAQQGKISQKEAEAFQKILEDKAATETRLESLERTVDRFNKLFGPAVESNRRKAQRAGRAP